VAQLGLDRRPAWINNQQDWPDVWGQGPDSLFGVFGTNWYHKLPLPAVDDFVRRWTEFTPAPAIPVPGNVSYNGYMCTRELLRAIVRAGTTKNTEVIKQLETLRVPAAERMQHFDAYMNPNTHQLQQTIYLAERNPAPSDPTDLFRLLSWSRPEEVEDDEAPSKCRLATLDSLRAVEP
jgi:branched-chain amino acid transport system substrate-binding protein